MNWIDKAIQERNRARQRERLIEDGAEQAFLDLWDEILSKATYAKEEHNLDVSTNGTHYERIVKFGSGHPARQGRILTISMDKSTKVINVEGNPAPSLQLTIDVCSDNVVCLKLEGKELSPEKAGEVILRPFFFPDPGQASSPSIRVIGLNS